MAERTKLNDALRAEARAYVEKLRAFAVVDAIGNPRLDLRQLDAALLVELHDEQAARIAELERQLGAVPRG